MKKLTPYLKNILEIEKVKKDELGSAILDLPIWIGYTFGPLFILLGLAFLGRWPSARNKVLDYKKRQLELYNKKNNKNVKRYDDTNLYLPFFEKIKAGLPIFLGLVFIVVGISWIVGNALSTKNF